MPVGNYMFKVNNRKARTKLEICSKLTIKTPEGCLVQVNVGIPRFACALCSCRITVQSQTDFLQVKLNTGKAWLNQFPYQVYICLFPISIII